MEVSDEWDVGEYHYFNDDVKFICDLLKENWDTFSDYQMEAPVFQYKPEQWMSSTKNSSVVYVYQISRYNSVSSTDYRTMQRTAFIAIRTSCRHRDVFYRTVDNIYKILLAFRRAGQKNLAGFTYMEIINDRISNDLTGWYTNTLDIKLTSYNYPVESDGFGLKGNGCDEDI